MKLNLGCGMDIRKGYINCDITNHEGVDKVVSLEKKLQFKDNSVDEILCKYVLEHLVTSPLKVLREFHRVLKPDGIVEIGVPFCKHPTAHGCDHIRTFTVWSFYGIQFPSKSIYENMFHGIRFEYTWKTTNNIINTILKIKLFRKEIGRGIIQYIYLPFISHFFPFECIHFRMVAKKD